MKRITISAVLVLLFLAFAQTTKAQSPVEDLTNQHLNFVERQGDNLQFMLDRLRYRRETGWYLGNRPYFGNGGFRFGNHYNYYSGRYRTYQGYPYNYPYGSRQFSIGRSGRYAAIGGLLGGGIGGGRGVLIGAGAGLLIGEIENRNERKRYRPTQIYTAIQSSQKACFKNTTSYNVNVYPIGDRRIAQLAPGSLWPIPGTAASYHTSVRRSEGTWSSVTLPVVPCN